MKRLDNKEEIYEAIFQWTILYKCYIEMEISIQLQIHLFDNKW